MKKLGTFIFVAITMPTTLFSDCSTVCQQQSASPRSFGICQPTAICPVISEPACSYNQLYRLLQQYQAACFYGFFYSSVMLESEICLVRNWQKRDNLVRQFASQLHWSNPCQLDELIRLFFPAEEQAFRWHVAQYLPHNKQEELNSAWYNYHNPDLAQPNPIRGERVYRMVRDWRKAHHANDQGRQIFLIEQLAPYFENKTVDFIAPLIAVCFHPDDKPLAYAISKYMGNEERHIFETVWNFTMIHKFANAKPLSHIPSPAEEMEQAQIQARLQEHERKFFTQSLDDFQTHRFGHTDAKTLQMTSPTA
ncbi:hypothetical protein M1466_03380 [Candidatus Dependentiae bacterium]|nr:hypothetical protein [Candidatus Dependentiae bacterium]